MADTNVFKGDREEGEVEVVLDGGTGRCYSLFSNSLVTSIHFCL